MIIRGMNNFFGRYSRWIFGIFTIVIIISFMGIMTPGQYSGCFMGDRNKAGTIFGKSVSYDDLREVMISTQVFYQALYGFMPREMSAQDAFILLAQLRAAEERGIVVSDKDIATYIKSIPAFQKDGKFDRELYNKYLQSLADNGCSEADLINGIRTQFMINSLSVEIQNSVIVTDNEVENFYRIMNEKITVRVADFKNNDYKAKIERSMDGMNAFFEANRDRYMIEPQAKALVAVFDFKNAELTKKANALMSPEALEKFYNDNKAKFTVTDKDGSRVTPFKDALEQVKIHFRDAKIRELATEKAQIFAKNVYEKASDEPAESLKIFNQMSKDCGVKVIACEQFKSSDTKIGGIESAALVKEIFDNSFEIPITNAVVADNGVYVAYVTQMQSARRAELAEVKNRVAADYIDDLARNAAKDAAEKVYGELKVLEPNEMQSKVATIAKFAQPMELDVKTIGDDVLKATLYSTAKGLAANDISQVLPTADGFSIVYVVKREMPKLGEEFAKEKDAIAAQYKELKVRVAMNEFFGYLDKQCMMMMQN
jgi:hypothetical protein